MPVTQIRNPETPEVLAPDFPICWVPICQTVLTAPAATVRLPAAGNFSQIYRSLRIQFDVRTDKAASSDDAIWAQFNGDNAANYHHQFGYFVGNNTQSSGATLTTTNFQAGHAYAATALANTFAPNEMWIQNYALTDRCKHTYTETPLFFAATAANVRIQFSAGIWVKTPIEPVNYITFFTAAAADFIAGSRFYVYGLL